MNLEEEIKELRDLLERIVGSAEDDPCWYDHHGYCQAHLMFEIPCPYTVAREFLEKSNNEPCSICNHFHQNGKLKKCNADSKCKCSGKAVIE